MAVSNDLNVSCVLYALKSVKDMNRRLYWGQFLTLWPLNHVFKPKMSQYFRFRSISTSINIYFAKCYKGEK